MLFPHICFLPFLGTGYQQTPRKTVLCGVNALMRLYTTCAPGTQMPFGQSNAAKADHNLWPYRLMKKNLDQSHSSKWDHKLWSVCSGWFFFSTGVKFATNHYIINIYCHALVLLLPMYNVKYLSLLIEPFKSNLHTFVLYNNFISILLTHFLSCTGVHMNFINLYFGWAKGFCTCNVRLRPICNKPMRQHFAAPNIVSNSESLLNWWKNDAKWLYFATENLKMTFSFWTFAKNYHWKAWYITMYYICDYFVHYTAVYSI